MELPFELHSKIVEFLTSLPNIHDSSAQRAFIFSAGLDSRLQKRINYSGSPEQFFQLLVSTLTDYGVVKDGRNALEAILETAKNSVGKDRKEYCDALIQELRTFQKSEELSHQKPPDSQPKAQSSQKSSQAITAMNQSSVSNVAQSEVGNVANSTVTTAGRDVIKGDKLSIKDIQADRTTIIGKLNIGSFEWNDEVKEISGNRVESSETHREIVQATKEDVLRFLLRVYRVEPGKKVNSQEIRKHLGLTREQMHDMILDLKEKGFIKATFLGDRALLEITTDGVTVLKE